MYLCAAFQAHNLTGWHEDRVLTQLWLTVDGHATGQSLSVHGANIVLLVGDQLVCFAVEHRVELLGEELIRGGARRLNHYLVFYGTICLVGAQVLIQRVEEDYCFVRLENVCAVVCSLRPVEVDTLSLRVPDGVGALGRAGVLPGLALDFLEHGSWRVQLLHLGPQAVHFITSEERK